ncbi:MAG: FAD-dependent oxidoreductase [Planctomycetota bacterium]|jgi:NADPH-dependent glutamate synthase beta subunit-like oxidoreductase
MTRLVIDNRDVEVPAGSTILDAARRLGMDIPTLCFLDGFKPSTSCMICLVKVKGRNQFVPSCATAVEEGMEVESETGEVHGIRRAGLELLLSDHVGDCTAPCQNTCPAHMDIPLMLRQVAGGELRDAIATVKSDIALPAVLGRVCPEVCERTCRRREVDSPASICLVKRHVADVDLASEAPYLPPCEPSTGKKIAIIGAGPTGLSAAYHLLQLGHACTVYDSSAEPGGMLRRDFDEDLLPRNVLDGEIAVIERLGAQFQMDVAIGKDEPLADLTDRFDAVLVAVGGMPEPVGGIPEPLGGMPKPKAPACTVPAKALGLQASKGRIEIDRKTHETHLPGVFAAGDAVQPTKLVVRNVADGKAAARDIDQYISRETSKRRNVESSKQEVPAARTGTRRFTSRAGRINSEELVQLLVGASEAARIVPTGGTAAGLTDEEARTEALRCLHCDCGNLQGCKLRKYAQQYGAVANRYRGGRKSFERHRFIIPDATVREREHAPPDAAHEGRRYIVYEPGKCILCGLCVQIATEAGEPLGLTFIGRGFDVRVGVPFDGTIAEGLTRVGERCADACPTGALVLGGAHGCDVAGCGASGMA